MDLVDRGVFRVYLQAGLSAFPVQSLAFSGDGHLLASGGEDCTVRVWDCRTGQLRTTLVAHREAVVGVAFSNDAAPRQTITSMDLTGEILVWPAATQAEVDNDIMHFR